MDGVTHEEYQKDAERNIRQLHRRLKDGKYQAQPLRRVTEEITPLSDLTVDRRLISNQTFRWNRTSRCEINAHRT